MKPPLTVPFVFENDDSDMLVLGERTSAATTSHPDDIAPDYDPRKDAYQRSISISAPEDEAILQLCERIGYGAVMDSAMRQWIKKDSMGAFYIVGCLGYRDGKPVKRGQP